jgi:hypothetical protein
MRVAVIGGGAGRGSQRKLPGSQGCLLRKIKIRTKD